MVKKWIQRAIHRLGKLHYDLEIPKEEKIPLRLLDVIINAKAGQTIKNPTSKGKKRILVTRKIEQRAILARNLKRLGRGVALGVFLIF
ncbi:hypothetical protein KAJ87_01390 [Candidatus Pacearchaeota archaeon]|nr:hypothetical protein [Candidatus Pacearchaeota archaeon]